MTLTVEQANELKARLENEGILGIINEKAGEMFGTKNDFRAAVKQTRRDEAYVKIEDRNKDVRNQLTSTPLLRSMFTDADLDAEVYYFEKETENTAWDSDEILVCFHISYRHPEGGGNGLRLGRLTISMDASHNTIIGK